MASAAAPNNARAAVAPASNRLRRGGCLLSRGTRTSLLVDQRWRLSQAKTDDCLDVVSPHLFRAAALSPNVAIEQLRDSNDPEDARGPLNQAHSSGRAAPPPRSAPSFPASTAPRRR